MTSDDWLFVDGLNASWHAHPAPAAHLVEGRIAAVNATVAANHDAAFALNTIGLVLDLIAREPTTRTLIRTAGDIRAAARDRRVGYILGFQDTEPFGDSLHRVGAFHSAGIRCVQLTYNFRNRVGCGCQEPHDTGLSEYGLSMVRRLNASGIVIDLSHCGERTSLDAVDASGAPVAITHANTARTRAHPRNKSPELVKRVAERGGVIGAVAFPPLLREGGTGTIDDYVAAIDDLVELVGYEHVALGPDFMEAMPTDVAASVLAGLPRATTTQFQSVTPLDGFASPAGFPALAEALIARGYAEAEARAIMGENWVEFYGRVWDVRA